MPFDGSGNFDRVHNFSADASAGIQAQATRFDAELDGIATGLENCQTLTGETTPTTDSPMGGFKHKAVAAATSTDNYLRADQSSNQVGIYVRDVNTGNTGTMTASAAVFPAAFTDGQRVTVKVSADGTASAPRVIRVNGLSANIIDNLGSTVPSFKMLKDGIFDLIYDSSAAAFRSITPRNDNDYDIATSAEVSAGTNVLKVVTPATFASGLDRETGTFTANWTGFAAAQNTVINFTRVGTQVTMHFNTVLNATSDQTFMSSGATEVPASLRPSEAAVIMPTAVRDNGTLAVGIARVTTAGALELYPDVGLGNFTASGSKGHGLEFCFTYLTD